MKLPLAPWTRLLVAWRELQARQEQLLHDVEGRVVATLREALRQELERFRDEMVARVRALEERGPGDLYERDADFHGTYARGLAVTGTVERRRRRERFYNLVQLFGQTRDVPGLLAECGCWKGLSSFVLCEFARRDQPDFRGAGTHIYDSFAGLSVPTPEDENPSKGAGQYAARLEDVQRALAAFPEVTYHPGWIPETFDRESADRYRFVHVDVDLYAPTRAALEHFAPRLAPGGVLVCDDYGSLAWPGARLAVDEFCARTSRRPLLLSTGQAVLLAGAP